MELWVLPKLHVLTLQVEMAVLDVLMDSLSQLSPLHHLGLSYAVPIELCYADPARLIPILTQRLLLGVLSLTPLWHDGLKLYLTSLCPYGLSVQLVMMMHILKALVFA